MTFTAVASGPALGTRAAAVVMQPTTACNLDCTYCYLPLRTAGRRMTPAVAAATADTVNRWSGPGPGRRTQVYWHCGEPLAVGRRHLASLMAPFHGVRHCVQTNATLIDDAWCEFFHQHQVRVSVSIDGPGQGSMRRTRAGNPANEQILAGLAALRRHQIPLAALTVVSDPDPDRAAALLEFFRELGCTRLGVILEKRLGDHAPPVRHDRSRIEEFWIALAEAWLKDPGLPVREIEHSLHAVARLTGDSPLPTPHIDPLPTITWSGDVVLIAPELAGFRDREFGDFSSGNVLLDPLDTIIAEAAQRTWWLQDHLAAARECATRCRHRPYCNGPDPATSYFEHGDLRRGATTHCQDSVIARADAICAPLIARAPASRRPTRPAKT